MNSLLLKSCVSFLQLESGCFFFGGQKNPENGSNRWSN